MIMSDRLDKYKSTYPGLEKQDLPRLVEKKKGYEAFTKAKGAENNDTLRLEYQDGEFDFFHYNQILKGSFRAGAIIITTTSGIYAIRGENLSKVAELISNRKIKTLTEFDPAIHEPVTDKNAAMIEAIENTD